MGPLQIANRSAIPILLAINAYLKTIKVLQILFNSYNRACEKFLFFTNDSMSQNCSQKKTIFPVTFGTFSASTHFMDFCRFLRHKLKKRRSCKSYKSPTQTAWLDVATFKKRMLLRSLLRLAHSCRHDRFWTKYCRSPNCSNSYDLGNMVGL